MTDLSQLEAATLESATKLPRALLDDIKDSAALVLDETSASSSADVQLPDLEVPRLRSAILAAWNQSFDREPALRLGG